MQIYVVCMFFMFFFLTFSRLGRETYSWILCVVLRVWTKTEGQADAVSYESACSLLNCSTNEEIKKWQCLLFKESNRRKKHTLSLGVHALTTEASDETTVF